MAAAAVAAPTASIARGPSAKLTEPELVEFVQTPGKVLVGHGWAPLGDLASRLPAAIEGSCRDARKCKYKCKIHLIITDGVFAVCTVTRPGTAKVWEYLTTETMGPTVMTGGAERMPIDRRPPGQQHLFVHGLCTEDPMAKRPFMSLAGGTFSRWYDYGHGRISPGMQEEVWSRVRSGLTMEFGRLVDEPATAEGAGAAARGTGSLTAFEQDMCQQWMAFNDCRTGRGGASIVNVCITAVLRVGVSLAPGSATRTKLLRHRLAHDEVRHMLLAREWSSADFDFLTETLKNLSFQDEVAELLFPTLEELAGVRHRREAAAGFPKLCIEYRDERDRIRGLVAGLLAERAITHASSPRRTGEIAMAALQELAETATACAAASAAALEHASRPGGATSARAAGEAAEAAEEARRLVARAAELRRQAPDAGTAPTRWRPTAAEARAAHDAAVAAGKEAEAASVAAFRAASDAMHAVRAAAREPRGDDAAWLSEQLLMGERSTAAARSCCAAALETATAGMLAAGE
ncbi:hypothetical protein FNF27_07546 [Cafeteria roenbergensis]|uniref:Uncharacterized protein n=1 Tax=Cafeteria roenbergensis TaxID=33653 RepID=A0A5A8DL87_CAFRO|nr:hypothetical protein FNF27_07546 [Cafeteria roenbergensis]